MAHTEGSSGIQQSHSAFKLAWMQFVSGGSAGFVEICLMHPLDVVKTRFQIQTGTGSARQYTSVIDCFRQMTKSEGFLAIYKGIVPPILADTPKRAVKFFAFEQYKKLFMFGSSSPNVLTFSLAGLSSGLTEAVVVNPFEVVKVHLQADKQIVKQQPSSFAVAREIARKKGFGIEGLNKGITATLGRHGVFNMVYFGFYFSVKEVIPPSQDPTVDFLSKFAIGFTAGTLASCANIPFDVAKSRIQGPQPVPGEVKYRKCFATMRTVYVEEGFFALYKGLVPKVMRLGPGGAVMFIVYESAYDFLQNKF